MHSISHPSAGRLHRGASVLSLRIVGVLAALGTAGCGHPNPAGTAAERAALFDEILAKTMARESFAPVKYASLGVDVESEMRRYRDEVIAAETEEALYYALVKVSNARFDRHLTVGLLDEGLSLDRPEGTDLANYPVPGTPVRHAPLRFAVDYGTEGSYFLFVGDHGPDLANRVTVGDAVVGVNGRPVDDYIAAVRPYHRYSTEKGFWWQVATWLPQRSFQFAPELYAEEFGVTLERRDGTRYEVTVPYLDADSIQWRGHGEQRYPGFRLTFSTQTYDLYRPEDDTPALVLDWYGFRENLVTDVDSLLAYAEHEGLLDHAVIFDGTRSRGGSLGAYALRRFVGRPFKTTFGNLRISDVTEAFVDTRVARLRDRPLYDAVPGDGDDGAWLLEWLDGDVRRAIARGDAYTANVPFKLAHLPKASDGVIQPAPVHFRGPLISWFSPYGGSHLDQFASIVIDNDLGPTLGMSPGGYSNTWEWEEDLRFPGTDRPVVRFMWSIGHTIRPNGEILEGNPAEVTEYVPVTRDNYVEYYSELLRRSLRHVRSVAGR